MALKQTRALSLLLTLLSSCLTQPPQGEYYADAAETAQDGGAGRGVGDTRAAGGAGGVGGAAGSGGATSSAGGSGSGGDSGGGGAPGGGRDGGPPPGTTEDGAARPDVPDGARPAQSDAAGPIAVDASPAVVDAPALPRPPDLAPALLGAGQPCSSAGVCATGFCVEGVCCDSACALTCHACAGRNTGLADGVCAPTRAGLDPDAECAAARCMSGMLTPAQTCDGRGACAAGAAIPCAPYVCDGTSRCKTACADERDCITGSYCSANACSGKKALGQSCSGATECASGYCADGVCCDSDCLGKCASCSAAETGRTAGVCAPVKAGTDPGADCSASDVATCGTDGECDGLGGCRKYGTTAVCAGEMCTSGSYTPARRCDGAGTCVSATSASCGVYVCGGSACKTSCSSHGDCVSTHFCGGTTCTLKKTLGTACAAHDECQSGVCGGRCCSQACNCKTQSAQNLIPNAGFDTNADGWMQEGTWMLTDATGCPYSGSIISSGITSSCFAVQPSTLYNFGLMANPPPDLGPTNEARCEVSLYQGSGCTGSLMSIRIYGPWESGWRKASGNVAVPAGFTSARVACFELDGHKFGWDMFYLSAAPAEF